MPIAGRETGRFGGRGAFSALPARLPAFGRLRAVLVPVAGRETAANAPDTVSSLESRNRCRMRRIYRKMMRRKYTSKSVTGAA